MFKYSSTDFALQETINLPTFLDSYSTFADRTIFGNTKYEVDKYKIKYPIGGGVALLHDIHERSLKAAEIFIKKAKKLNIEIVPLDEVDEFSYKNKSCQAII